MIIFELQGTSRNLFPFVSRSFILALVLICENTSTAQLVEADSLFTQRQEYRNALEKYMILDGTYSEGQLEFSYVKNRIAECLYLFSHQQLVQHPDTALYYSITFLDFLENNSRHLKPKTLNKKYWSFRNLICASNALKKFKLAEIYEDSLFTAFENQKLPKGLDKHFCFEIIELDSTRAYGYKTYAKGRLDSIPYFYEIFKLDKNGEENYKMYSLNFLIKNKAGRNFSPKYIMWYEPSIVPYKRRPSDRAIKGDSYHKVHSSVIKFLTLNPTFLTDKKT